MSTIKLTLVASLAVAGLAGGSLASAQAATTYACEFSGNTTSMSEPVQLFGGSASWGFFASTTCSLNGGAPQAGSITATGLYEGVACGTGDWTGNMSLSVGGKTVSTAFVIQFFAGHGALRIGALAETHTSDPLGSGYVNVRPAGTGGIGTPPDCITKYDAIGAFALQVVGG